MAGIFGSRQAPTVARPLKFSTHKLASFHGRWVGSTGQPGETSGPATNWHVLNCRSKWKKTLCGSNGPSPAAGNVFHPRTDDMSQDTRIKRDRPSVVGVDKNQVELAGGWVGGGGLRLGNAGSVSVSLPSAPQLPLCNPPLRAHQQQSIRACRRCSQRRREVVYPASAIPNWCAESPTADRWQRAAQRSRPYSTFHWRRRQPSNTTTTTTTTTTEISRHVAAVHRSCKRTGDCRIPFPFLYCVFAAVSTLQSITANAEFLVSQSAQLCLPAMTPRHVCPQSILLTWPLPESEDQSMCECQQARNSATPKNMEP